MSLMSLYHRAPSWMQAGAVAGMGAYRHWERLRGEFPALLAQASAATYASPGELRAIRERLWSERVRASVASVAAYGHRSLELAEVAGLPILTKAAVRQDVERFVCRDYPRWRRVRAHTSGSTGAGLKFLVTRSTIRRNYAHVWRFRASHGIRLGEWCGVFGGNAVVSPARRRPPFWRVAPVGRTVLFSQYHLGPETARHYLEEIRDRGLRWIHGYPSVIGLLAQFGIDAGLAGSVQVPWITLASENVSERQRAAIRRMFGVAPRQHYSMTESVAMICECPEGRLHVDEDFSLVEFCPIADIPGAHRLVGTTLDNGAFPLLRYDVGDVVRLAGPEPCPCGRSGRVVSSIDGRQEDYLVLADGSRVGRSGFFKDAVRVVEAQIVQRAAGEATLRLVRASGYGDADEAALRDEIRRRVGDRLAVTFEYVDRLPRTRSGKLRLVVSELPEAKRDAAADGRG